MANERITENLVRDRLRELGYYDPDVQKVRHTDLMAFSRELHDFMRDDVKASENEKPLFVSGSLIALRNPVFAKTFGDYAAKELPDEWLRVIKSELRKAEIPNSKKETIALPYSNIASHPEIAKRHKKYPKGVLHELIKRLNEKVWPFISVYHDFDVIGQFYGEFLKYTGGDKKALGIVLTPRHITELCALLANVNKGSKVLDICAGTGGFLISAMHQMFKSAVTEKEREKIKKESLIGIEQQPNMFALAASNMMLRGDGKANNLHQSSCFEDSVTDQIRELRCDVGLLNPPYAQGDEDLHELYFVGRMLDCLRRGGIGIAVVPMNCAIAPHKARAELLKKHTLEAVMSLPDLLFTPVGVITCLMIFTAKVPHETSNKKSWFGYWKDDGFIKTKHLGRIDSGRWPEIRDRWVETFRNREIVPGESVVRRVTAEDEWCAEAYMETDYSKLTQADFERAVRNYAVYRLVGSSYDAISEGETDGESR